MTNDTLDAARSWLAGEPVSSIQDQIKTFGNHYRSFRHTWKSNRNLWNHTTSLIEERFKYIDEFGFSLPNLEAINLLSLHQPLIEVGAGSGFWSALLQMRGVDIIATDPRIERHATMWDDHIYAQSLPIQAKTAVRRWPNRNVFCSWPSLNETWLRQAAKAMRPGRFLFAVYEEACADERTWDYISDNFEEITSLELISWHTCHDQFMVWRKRGRVPGACGI